TLAIERVAQFSMERVVVGPQHQGGAVSTCSLGPLLSLKAFISEGSENGGVRGLQSCRRLEFSPAPALFLVPVQDREIVMGGCPLWLEFDCLLKVPLGFEIA